MKFFQEQIDAVQAPEPAKRGVIYARYSSDMQEASDSIEVQVAECTKYALSHGIILTREPFVDRAETGTSTENRRSYQRLLAIAQDRARDFDLILTFHTSRWGRGIESEIDEHLLEKNGVKVIAVSQPVTADDAVESIFMKGILRKIDAYFSMQTSKYTHAYQSSNARNGFRNGGPPPDGFAIKHVPTGKKDRHGEEQMKSQLVLDTRPGKHDLTNRPRYEMAQYAFEQMYMGKGLRSVAKLLRDLGWRNRHAPKPIASSTIRTWFTNPTYTGYMAWNRVKFFRRNGKRNYRHNPVSKWIYSDQPSHPAIVKKEVFEAVALKFLRRDHRLVGRPRAPGEPGAGPGRNSVRYLLSGLIECGACGANYVAVKTIHRGKSPVVSFGCNARERWGRKECSSRRINMGLAEGVVMDTLLNRLLHENTVRQFVGAFNKAAARRQGEDDGETARLAASIARIEGEIDRMKNAILKGVDPTTFVDEMSQRQAELRGLQREAKRRREEAVSLKLHLDDAPLEAWMERLRSALLSYEFDSRRALVHRLVRKIVVAPDRSARLTWDLPATLTWRSADKRPDSGFQPAPLSAGITKNGCGGLHQTPCPGSDEKIVQNWREARLHARGFKSVLPEVRLHFRPVGPQRWPFGYEVLRRYIYPDYYPVPQEYRDHSSPPV